MPSSKARQRLLDAAVAYVSQHGVTDRSLRELAQAIGTSHRMLLYHFGSKEQLLVAIVDANEQAQQASVAAALSGPDRASRDAFVSLWHRLADPSMWPSERLFFELYGQALQGRPGTTSLLDGIVTSWIEPAAEVFERQGATPPDARAEARLILAVVRGLLLDLLATGDRAGVDGAMHLFLGFRAPPPRPQDAVSAAAHNDEP